MEFSNNKLKDKQAFYGFRKAFIRNTDLSPEARLILIIMMTHKGKNSYCWPSHRTLCKELGRNRDSIRKYIKELIFHGYLVTKSQGIGRSLLYTPSYWKISAGSTSTTKQDEKPAEENIHQPADSTLNRSISSGNKDRGFKTGKELFDQKRRELGLI
jgi:biotin operon repressor